MTHDFFASSTAVMIVMKCMTSSVDIMTQFSTIAKWPILIVWNHAHALNVRVDLESSIAALDGMKN
jgi:hypothetical protein